MGEPAIVVEDLGKTFRPPAGLLDMMRGRFYGAPIEALRGVSFKVERGEVVWVIGGLLSPSAGRAIVEGSDAALAIPELRRKVSFIVGDERSFHFRVSGRGNLHYFAALHGLPAGTARRRAAELLDRVGLGGAADRRYGEYSRGMRQRMAIARGLLGDPSVLLLDEPTLGLDPRGARDLRAFLREEVIRRAGRTAIVCSNDPTEVRALGDRVLFLETGLLRGEAGPDRIEAELGL